MYNFACKILKLFIMLIFRVEVHGRENIPMEGGIMLCSNHISNWDPPVLQVFLPRRIYYMAKDELFHVFFVVENTLFLLHFIHFAQPSP